MKWQACMYMLHDHTYQHVLRVIRWTFLTKPAYYYVFSIYFLCALYSYCRPMLKFQTICIYENCILIKQLEHRKTYLCLELTSFTQPVGYFGSVFHKLKIKWWPLSFTKVLNRKLKSWGRSMDSKTRMQLFQ